MSFWEKVKEDISKGYKEGLAAIKEGSIVVKEKADQLAEEGKKQIKLFELKQNVQGLFTDLGGRIYEITSGGKKSLLNDEKVKTTLSNINKIEGKITKLESKPSESTKTKTVKRKSSGATPKKRTTGKGERASKRKKGSSTTASSKKKK